MGPSPGLPGGPPPPRLTAPARPDPRSAGPLGPLARSLACAAIVLTACGDTTPSAPPPSRVDAVRSRPAVTAQDVAAFCDAGTEGTHPYAAPALREPTAPTTGWQWINLWATWCAPCVAEMPIITTWDERLTTAGHPVRLTFVSADQDERALKAFRVKHPELPVQAHLADTSTAAIEAWLGGMGFQVPVALPVHLWVDPQGQVRCLRVGGVDDGHYEVVKALLASG